MKNPLNTIFQIICFLLILLWIYAASSKLMDFGMFRAQMHKQVLFPFLKNSIAYLLPPAEIIAGIALLFQSFQKFGLYFSFIMLLCFTVYVGLAVLKVFHKIPCSCGGLIGKMGWQAHLVFNIFFLLLTALGIYIVNKRRRAAKK